MKPTNIHSTVLQSDASQTVAIAPGEIIIGTLVGINAQGQPLVEYPASPVEQALSAMSTLGLTQQHIGRQVALLFANGNPHHPVIMGIIHSPLHDLITAYELTPAPSVDQEAISQKNEVDQELTVNGQRLVIEGKEEIVLKCGDASITLTKSGKILIRGKYVLTRSEGVNRIMGGSVQVN